MFSEVESQLIKRWSPHKNDCKQSFIRDIPGRLSFGKGGGHGMLETGVT